MADETSFDEEISYFGGVEEHGNQFGVWKKGSFLALSNFKVDFCVEVRAQKGKKKSGRNAEPCGYICEVTYRDGRALGRAFVSSKDSEDRLKFTESLRSSLGCPSLKCNANNTQLGSYLMTKLEENIRNGEVTEKFAANCTGLQCSKCDSIWVLNEDVQIDSNGLYVEVETSPYVWINSFLDEDMAALVKVSKKKKGYIRDLVLAIEECYQENTSAALLTIGAEVMSLHYESLVNKANVKVPATVVVGQVNLGKSKATAAALSIVGVHKSNMLGSITDSRSRTLAMTTTLGYVIDDPSDPVEIADKIMYHFDREKTSSERGTFMARCTFITSINQELLHKLSSMPSRYITRVVMIPFVEGNTMNPVARRKADLKLSQSMEKASNGAAIVIGLGNTLIEDVSELDDVLEKVTSLFADYGLQKAKQRIYTSYSLLLFATLKLLEKLKMRDKYEGGIWQFFQQHMLPVIEKHQVGVADSNRELFEELLLKAVHGQVPSVVKSFVRVEYVRGSDKPSAVSVLVPHLEQQLRSKKIIFNQDLLSSIPRYYPGMSRGGVSRTFLSIGSHLENIPKGSKGRKATGTVYLRSVEIDAAAIQPSTLDMLVKAFEGQTDHMEAIVEHDISLDDPVLPVTSSPVVSNEHVDAESRVQTAKNLKELTKESIIKWKPKPRRKLLRGVRALSSSPLKLNKHRKCHSSICATMDFQGKKIYCAGRCVSISPAKLGDEILLFNTRKAARAVRALNFTKSEDATILRRSRVSRRRSTRSTLHKTAQQRGSSFPAHDEHHCQSCGKKFTRSTLHQCVGCESKDCWRWWHFFCVGLTQLPTEDQTWVCPVCSPPSGCLSQKEVQ